MTIKTILTLSWKEKNPSLTLSLPAIWADEINNKLYTFVSSNNIYIAASPSKEFITYKHNNACQDDLLFQGVTPPSMYVLSLNREVTAVNSF